MLYRQQGHSTGTLYTTSRQYIDLPLHADGNYVVEVRAHTEGGDGAVAKIDITGNRHHHLPLLVPSIHNSEHLKKKCYKFTDNIRKNVKFDK